MTCDIYVHTRNTLSLSIKHKHMHKKNKNFWSACVVHILLLTEQCGCAYACAVGVPNTCSDMHMPVLSEI